MRLPSSTDLTRDVRVKNKLETNSVVQLYFQIEPELGGPTNLIALADLFHAIVQEPFFDRIRTQKALGYDVECFPLLADHVLGFSFCVTSSSHDPEYLQGEIDSFIDGLEGLLDKLDDASFENYKSGVITSLLEKYLSLSNETDRYWEEIEDRRYMFDSKAKQAEEVKHLQKSDVMRLYDTYFRQSSEKCQRLAVRVWGCNTVLKGVLKGIEASAPALVVIKDRCKPYVVVIKDLAALKESSAYYPAN